MIRRIIETGSKYRPKEKGEYGLLGAGGVGTIAGIVVLFTSGDIGGALEIFSASGGAIAFGVSRIKNRVINEEEKYNQEIEADKQTIEELRILIESSRNLPEEQKQEFEENVREGRKLASQYEMEATVMDLKSLDTFEELKKLQERVKTVLGNIGMEIGDRNPLFLFPKHLNLPDNPEISYQMETLKKSFSDKGLGVLMEEL